MKIGIIVSVYLPSTIAGGVTSVAADHAQELAARGHTVTVLTSNLISLRPREYIDQREEVHGNIRIIRFASSAIVPHFSFIFSLSLLQWLKKHAADFDVFHIHYARELFALSTAEVLMRLGSKVFLQSHGMLDRRGGMRQVVDTILVKNQMQRARGVFALQSHEYGVQKGISPQAQIIILPNGIRLSGIPSWEYKKNRQNRKILFLSRLHPVKRVADFIDAAQILLSKQANLEFIIIGPDGGDKDLAEQKIRSSDLLRSQIKLIGPVNREAALNAYADADVYALPSVSESFSLTLMEALAVGVPSIVTDRIYLADLVKQYDVAEIVSPGPVALAYGIEKLLSDQQLCLERSLRGRDMVENMFTIEEVAKQMEKYYSI
jgi:glycosyltransferase involved in cell wall biosynthesis